MFLRKFIILFSLIIASSAFSGQFDAKVIKVIDGDTIWVKTENKHVKIRLSYIDAPELRQTFGVRSKNYLTNLVLDKKVQIDTYRKDRYNRIIGEVYIHDDRKVTDQVYDRMVYKYGDRVRFVDNKDNITEPIFIVNL